MANIEGLNRQHEKIEEIMSSIEQYINNNQIENKVSDIIKEIGYLAGILSIHLKHEDQYIYPNLINSGYEEAKKISEYYLEEMNEIADSFNKYKKQFNTSRKILSQTNTFMKETNRLFSILRKRIEREDSELYEFLSKLDDREFIKISLSKKEDRCIS